MQSPFRFLAGITVWAIALTAVSAASAAPANQGNGPSNPGNGRQSHDEIVAYWTPDRVANARPREITRPVPTNPQAKPPGAGGGGGGGSTTSVTGASWNGSGLNLVKKTEGKVLFRMGGGDWVCSGTVVNDTRANSLESLVLTAGHCVYDQTDGWASSWMFMPDFDSAPSSYSGGTFNCLILPYGCWTATALITSAGWRVGNFNEDYAFAVIGGRDGAALDDTVGSHAIAFSSSRPSSVYAFGYPQGSPYAGSDLVYCSGSTVNDGWGGSTDSGLNCNMTGGSSGGGWFKEFNPSTGTGTLVSVNSFRYNFGPYSKYMFGPLFDSDTAATYAAAQSATGNIFR